MDNISRRQFTKAAAWSVPVIAAAVAVPMAAASIGGVCTPVDSTYSPESYPNNHHMGRNYNAWMVTLTVDEHGNGKVVAVALSNYNNASALNIDGALFDKTDRVRKGDIKAGTFKGCNPGMIQVDGNNVHWYNHVNNGQGGWQ